MPSPPDAGSPRGARAPDVSGPGSRRARRRRPSADARRRRPGCGRRSGACPSLGWPGARSRAAGSRHPAAPGAIDAPAPRGRGRSRTAPRREGGSSARAAAVASGSTLPFWSTTPYCSRACAGVRKPARTSARTRSGSRSPRIAVAAAGRRADAHDVAGLEVQDVHLADVRGPAWRVAVDHAAARGPGPPALEAPGGELEALHPAGGHDRVRVRELEVEPDAPARPGCGRVRRCRGSDDSGAG